MIAEIVTVGSELVSGQEVDTNSAWLSQRLGALGIEVHFHTSIGDDLAENVQALRVAASRVDLVIVSGGLGPTQDDLTRAALAEFAGVSLVEDAASLAAIVELFRRRNRTMSPGNRVQALFPEGAHPLPNPIGTAPGVWMHVGETVFACLPGVPGELKRMFDEQVAPRLRRPGRVFIYRVVNLFGKGESEIESLALDLTARGRKPEVGITASDATISFRVTGEGRTEREALDAIEPTLSVIRERFGALIVGEGDIDVPDAVVESLVKNGKTLAVAESCTGGLIAHQLTAIAGVSAVFPGGVVSYSNEAKHELLGVPIELLERHGAVSAEVAEAMARGARSRFHADIALSTTGIAGPAGGSADKPVGLVYLGLAVGDAVESRRLELGPEQPRDVIQSRAAKHALNWVRISLRDQQS